MNIVKNIKAGVCSVLFLLALNITAQETVSIPLSNPQQAGILKMGIVRGSISIKGYDGDEVKVTGTRRKSDDRRRFIVSPGRGYTPFYKKTCQGRCPGTPPTGARSRATCSLGRPL